MSINRFFGTINSQIFELITTNNIKMSINRFLELLIAHNLTSLNYLYHEHTNDLRLKLNAFTIKLN